MTVLYTSQFVLFVFKLWLQRLFNKKLYNALIGQYLIFIFKLHRTTDCFLVVMLGILALL